MHPYLFELPNGTPVPTWGVIITATVVSLIVLGNRMARRDGGYPNDLVLEVAIIVFACHTIGGRFGYVRANWGRFEGNWKGLLDITSGGSAFLESLLLITVALGFYMRWRRIPVWNGFDLAAPLLAVGQAVGRFGCLFAGCCYGKPTDSVWGITFTHPESLAKPLGVALHPTQIYEMGTAAVLAVLLFWFRPRRRFRGQVALLYLTIYPFGRFGTELFRGDPKRGWFMEEQLGQVLSNPQAMSIGMLTAAAALWFILPRMPGARDLRTSGAELSELPPAEPVEG